MIVVGDARHLPFADSVAQTCVTSPPYFGLRDYGVDAQIGQEETVDAYVEEIVAALREVWRVLRDDGTLWLNIGDSYAGARGGAQGAHGAMAGRAHGRARQRLRTLGDPGDSGPMGVPWRLAFALRAAGWRLRSAIVWHKPNPLPESVKDRPTKSYEHVFLFAKRTGYFYDRDAIAEPAVSTTPSGNGFSGRQGGARDTAVSGGAGSVEAWDDVGGTRNARDVWTLPTQPTDVEHFATMPRALARRCILAGSRGGDVVLDPFAGVGTTLVEASALGRRACGVEINPKYAALGNERIRAEQPGLALGAA